MSKKTPKAKPKTAKKPTPRKAEPTTLLTAAQVKASVDKPTQRGTPIGELHHLGCEIRARLGKLNYHGGKAVDWKDSIDRLLADAAKLCDRKGFEAFKEHCCPEFCESWTYQLLAIEEGRKTIEELRAATRLRVAKHRAGKRAVTKSNSVTPAPAASGAKPPTIRLQGGQPVDIEGLSPKAQAQLTEKLLPAATEPKDPAELREQRKAIEAEKLLLPGARRALAEGEAERLDRLFGSGGSCMPLSTQVIPMLEMILDDGPQPLKRFVECVDANLPRPPSILNALGGTEGFTSVLLDQLADSGLVVPENNVWKTGPEFRAGESLIFIPQYGERAPYTVIVWGKDERAELNRQTLKQMAIVQIGTENKRAQDEAHTNLRMAFKEGMAAWFDDDIFNLPTKIFAGAVSSDHLRKVADLLIRIADEQSKSSDTRH